jgi:hypothetical protein
MTKNELERWKRKGDRWIHTVNRRYKRGRCQ